MEVSSGSCESRSACCGNCCSNGKDDEDAAGMQLHNGFSSDTVVLRESASDLALLLQDERDAFLFEYGELEQELFDLRTVVGDMQQQIDDAERRWAQERELKLQLERQVMSTSLLDSRLIRTLEEEGEGEDECTHSGDEQQPSSRPWSASEIEQPCTPSGEEDYAGGLHRLGQSVNGSSLSESPGRSIPDKPSEDAATSLGLAFEAQVALAKLREEHRHVVEELISAKLQIAHLQSEQGLAVDKAHLTVVTGNLKCIESCESTPACQPGSPPQEPRKQSSGWFTRSRRVTS